MLKVKVTEITPCALCFTICLMLLFTAQINAQQEILIDDLPAGELSVAKLVGSWRFPLAQALDDVTWSLPPTAKKNLDSVSPSAEPEPEVDDGQDGDDVIVPWIHESAPPGAVPPPDQKPLYDFPLSLIHI